MACKAPGGAHLPPGVGSGRQGLLGAVAHFSRSINLAAMDRPSCAAAAPPFGQAGAQGGVGGQQPVMSREGRGRAAEGLLASS
jgi:hypothetical protein